MIIAALGIGQAAISATDASKGKGAATRIFSLLDTEAYPNAKSEKGKFFSTRDPRRRIQHICLRNLRFEFPGSGDLIPVYRNLILDIHGGVVAIVGESGCGKTTLIQLLLRFYELPGRPCLFLNGSEIRDYNVRSLRSRMSLVSQEPILFNDSVAENIRFGKMDASESDINRAALMANAHEFIMELESGYSTNVGIRGEKLSGGQRQRIALARALLRDSDILLLDEATSALDPVSERVVQEALDRSMSKRGGITIIVAHRLSTIKQADMIVVLKKAYDYEGNSIGSYIAEIGSHEDLLKIENGEYQRLVRASEQ